MEKRELRLGALFMFGIYAVYALVWAPLYQYLIYDFVLQDTLWLDLVDVLYQHTEILGFSALLACLTSSIWRHGVRGSAPMLLLCSGAIAFKYLATVISISSVGGSVNLTGGLTEYLFSFFLELALAALSVLLCSRLIVPVVEHHRALIAAGRVLNTQTQEDPCYPFHSLFRWRNPVQRTLFWSLLAFIALRLAAFIISDFAYGVAITLTDIPVMLLYWVILIFLQGFLGYLLSLRIFSLFAKKQA